MSEPRPPETTEYCEDLWKFSKELKQNPDDVAFRKSQLEIFLLVFVPILEEKLQQRFPHLTVLPPYLAGSTGNETNIDDSDFDVVLRLQNNGRRFRHIAATKEWAWPFEGDSKEVKKVNGAQTNFWLNSYTESIQEYLQSQSDGRFQLDSSKKKEKYVKCLSSWTSTGELEFDLLLAVDCPGKIGVIAQNEILASDNQIATLMIQQADSLMAGFRPMIRLFKWLGYRFKTTNSNYCFPSCGFESILLEIYHSKEGGIQAWKVGSSFFTIFTCCLMELSNHLSKACLSPPNDASANLFGPKKWKPEASLALEEFIAVWVHVHEPELLTLLTQLQNATRARNVSAGSSAPAPIQ